MKLLFLFSLTFIGLISFSQTFQCLRPENSVFFQQPDDAENTPYLPVKIDSIEVVDNDTIFYFYKKNGSYFTTYFGITGIEDRQNASSWLGKKMIKTVDNKNIFFTLENDSVVFDCDAQVGQDWVFLSLDDKYIKCSVVREEEHTFIGITDQVKILNFQTYSMNHNPIEDPMNEMEYILSQNYGLVKCTPFAMYPTDTEISYTSELELSGINELQNGVFLPTRGDIYNYNIGDVFHYKYTYALEVNYIKQVIGKQFSDDSLSVTYEFLVTEWGREFISDESIPTGFSTQNYTRSYEETESYSELNNSVVNNIHPFEETAESSNSYYLLRKGYGERIWVDFGYSVTPWVGDEIITTDFIEGCGTVLAWNDTEGNYSELNLVYYKKGTGEWGVELEYVSILEHENTLVSLQYRNGTIYINTQKDVTGNMFELLSTCGQTLLSGKVENGNIVPNVELSEGAYIFRIYNDKQFYSDVLISNSNLNE